MADIASYVISWHPFRLFPIVVAKAENLFMVTLEGGYTGHYGLIAAFSKHALFLIMSLQVKVYVQICTESYFCH